MNRLIQYFSLSARIKFRANKSLIETRRVLRSTKRIPASLRSLRAHYIQINPSGDPIRRTYRLRASRERKPTPLASACVYILCMCVYTYETHRYIYTIHNNRRRKLAVRRIYNSNDVGQKTIREGVAKLVIPF